MRIAIASGKGGTGKTLVATNLARILAERGETVTYVDCDVEEPNGHLFLHPDIATRETVSVKAPEKVDEDRCTQCGQCVEACRYNAMALLKEKVLIFPELCHACGACSTACPEEAISEYDKKIGELQHGHAGAIAYHSGVLETAVGGMSPRLIHAAKEHIGDGIAILDSPPGTACSAVETVNGADLVLLVTDPTPFAVHDLELSVNMCRQVGQEPVVMVNRSGRDEGELRAYCERARLEIIGDIPDDRRIAEVYSVGQLMVDELPEYRPQLGAIADRVLELAGSTREVLAELVEPSVQITGNEARSSRPDSARIRPPELVVISGKGGTGKTSIAACFAQLGPGATVADCDVDAADLHLVLTPEVREEGDFVGGMLATIDPDSCTACGACLDACRFDAIDCTDAGGYSVDAARCEGCGVCGLVCPVDAVADSEVVNGNWYVSSTRFGPMAHAVLGHAEENSGRLVTLVRDLAMGLATEEGVAGAANSAGPPQHILIDGSPGTGCPVIASLTGARYAVIVTEPTVSGQHDLGRVLELVRHFGLPAGVIVNKADLNQEMADRIRAEAEEAGADFLGKLPYEPAFTDAQIARQTLLEHADTKAGRQLCHMWEWLCDRALSTTEAGLAAG